MKWFNEEISIFGLITIIVLLLEGIIYIRELIAPITSNKFSKYMSWRRLNRLIKKLAEKIEESGITYDMIVAPGRGGAICASLLSCYLGSIPVLILDREYKESSSGKIAKFYESKIIINDEYSHLKNGNILLLTQQSDPGITLREIERILIESGFKNIEHCAVLKSKKSCNNKIRYYAYQYSSHKKCKMFPWEKINGYRNIMHH